MPTEMGEFVVGGYLKEILGCEFVDYGVRPPGGGLPGLGELDVIGLRFADRTAFLCEVTTHIRGLLIGSYAETIDRIKKKYERQQSYATQQLANFEHHRFMFWSPVVPRGTLTQGLAALSGLEIVINDEYARHVAELQEHVRKAKHDLGNPFLRALQILACLRQVPLTSR
jgi:hypothetical protein